MSNQMREREIRYMVDGENVTAPLSPDMSDGDAWEIAKRVNGVIYERSVTPWRHVITNGDPGGSL